MPLLTDADQRHQLQVAPPPFTPYRFGLDSVLTWRSDPDEHWRNGVGWESVICTGAADITRDPCALDLPPGSVPDKTMQDAEDSWFHAEPFSVYVGSQGSSLCKTAADRQAHAQALLEAHEASGVENVIMDVLANEAIDIGFSDQPAFAVGALENALAGGYGGLGTIWASRLGATWLLDKGIAVVTGGKLTTKLGTPIVAAAWKAESADPDAQPPVPIPDAVTIFATGALLGYRSSVETYDGFDHNANRIMAVAERTYVVGWDCGALSVTAPTNIQP